jgi:hypothetical protein
MTQRLLKLVMVGWLGAGAAMLVACGTDSDLDPGNNDSARVPDAGISPQPDAGLTPRPDAGSSPQLGRKVGTMNVSEGSYLGKQSAKMNASFKVVVPVCADVQTFDQCSITTKPKLSCTPACGAGQVCVWKADCSAGQCVDSVPLNAGEITVSGATHQDPLSCGYSATREPPGYECDVNTQQDVFDPGDQLHIVAQGDSFAAFEVDVEAPPDHSFTTDTDSWSAATFDGSADVPLRWDTTETADEFKMTLKGKTGDLVCRFPDTGSFSIPKEGLTAIGGVVQVDIHRQNKFVVNPGADGEVTILTVSGLAIAIPDACFSCKQYSQACQTSDCPELDDVCSGAARDAATTLVDCLCAQCATECQVMCSGSGSDTGCQACKQAASGGACSAQRSACMSN